MSYKVSAIVQEREYGDKWRTILDIGIYTREMMEFLTPEPHCKDGELKNLGEDFLERVCIEDDCGTHVFDVNEWRRAYRRFCDYRWPWKPVPFELKMINYMMEDGETRLIAFRSF